MSHSRTPEARPGQHRLVVAVALALVLTCWPVRAAGETTRVDVRAVDYVDANTGADLGQAADGQPFHVRYAVRNRADHPVLLASVQGDFGSPPPCPVAPVASGPRELGVMVPGEGTVELVDEATTWQRVGSCQDTMSWRATEVVAERVPSSTSVAVADHRSGEQPRLRAAVSSRWASTPGRVEFLVDGRSVGEARVLDGGAVLDLPANSLAPGRHEVVARYLPDPQGPASSSSSAVTVQVAEAERSSRVLAAASDHRHDAAGRLSARVEPADAAGAVQFEVDGRPLGGPVPVRDGYAQRRTEPGTLAVGEHRLRATFHAGEESLAGSSADTSFSVTQVPSSIRADVGSRRVQPGSSVRVTGQVLLGEGGHRLPAESRVDVLDAQGGRIAAVEPSRDGDFSLDATVPSSAQGRYLFFVSYPGSSTFSGAILDRSVQVEAVSPTPSPSPDPTPAVSPVTTPASTSPAPSSPSATPSPAPLPADPPAEDRTLSASAAPALWPLALGLGMLLLGAGLAWRRAVR